MNPRELTESGERGSLSAYACKSAESKGRKCAESQCDIRTAFQRDRDRIIHSKSFRRLMHKTQVFLAPESSIFMGGTPASSGLLDMHGDHFRTRLTHTLEVAQISRTIARALRLNEDLTEAIALGHDLGHSPFGHDGETVLDALLPGFLHNEQSVRVVERLEKDGAGLNLTAEVIDGIRNHPLACKPATLEGQIVRLSDKIAYINHDIDDAIRAGVLAQDDLPADVCALLGDTLARRIDFLVRDIVGESWDTAEVRMSERAYGHMMRLYDFMFEKVYFGNAKNTQFKIIKPIITTLFAYFLEHTDQMPAESKQMLSEGETPARCVCDYIAGMTDRFAIRVYNEITKNQEDKCGK